MSYAVVIIDDEPPARAKLQRFIAELADFRVIALDSLVSMKLMSNRDKDRTHLRDLISVGLIDATWLPNLPPALAERLKRILDTPDG